MASNNVYDAIQEIGQAEGYSDGFRAGQDSVLALLREPREEFSAVYAAIIEGDPAKTFHALIAALEARLKGGGTE